MKKQIVLALIAVIAIAESAEANRRRGTDGPPAVEAARAEAGRVRAREGVTSTGADAISAHPFQRLQRETNLFRSIDAVTKNELQSRSSEKAIQDLMKDILENGLASAKLQRLSVVRLRAAVLLPKNFDLDVAASTANLTADMKADLAFAKLVLRPYTSKFSEANIDATTFLIEKTTEIVEMSGGRKTIADGMKEANDMMAKPRAERGLSTRLDLENVNKYCK